jgi:hypothetical protein
LVDTVEGVVFTHRANGARGMETRLILAIGEALRVPIQHRPIVKHHERMALAAESSTFIECQIEEAGTRPTDDRPYHGTVAESGQATIPRGVRGADATG